MPPSTAPLPPGLPSPEEFLPALLDLLLTSVAYHTPLFDAAGDVADFALLYLNPAAQRLQQLPAQPARTYGEHQKVWGSRGQQLLRLTWEAVLVCEDHDSINPCFTC